MAVPALSAARTICELRGWTVSNLELQKLLFIGQLLHLGTHHRPLVVEAFEAWDYGPVIPQVYTRARGFGSGPVRNVFHWIPPVAETEPEYATLVETLRQTKGLTPGQLVNLTHWSEGAWAQHYRAGRRGIVIPNADIADEFRKRFAA